MNPKASIGVFGGSGFYSFLDNAREVAVETPFGKPSAPITIGEIGGKSVAFLPRHGKKHEFPPHAINYRANLWAFKELGVKRVFGPCAAGSLKKDVKPGDFVVCDQFVDRTWGRKDTFFDGLGGERASASLQRTAHVSAADPYCPELRKIVLQTGKKLGITMHDKGTVVVINGPRFSTRAESAWFSRNGWEVVNMTQYPECILAKELELCYANISLITDYDVGLEGIPPVTNEEVARVFGENNARLRKLLFEAIEELPERRGCGCGESMKNAFF